MDGSNDDAVFGSEIKGECIITLTKQRVLNAFSKIKGKKILLLDNRTFNIINSICDIRNITNIGISLVEMVDSNRSKMKDMDAIYFIEPTESSVKHLIRDFNIPESTHYKQAHVFLTYDEDRIIEIISKYSNVVNSIRTFQIAHLDYIPVEQRLFLFGDENNFFNLYSPDSNKLHDSCNVIVQKLFGLCSTFNYPIIRYSRSHPLTAAMTAKLCGLLENKEIDIGRDGKSVLLLVDRTNDLISPLIHEFTYQAMISDILGLDDKGRLIFKSGSGLNEGKEFALSEKDRVWAKTRHWHIEIVQQKIASSAKHLHFEQNVSCMKKKDLESKGDVKGLFELAKNVPINQALASKLSEHLDLITLCYSHFKNAKIESVSTIEQDLATGMTSKFKKLEYKKVFKAMNNIMKDPEISLNNKLRLLMIHLNTGPLKDNWKELLTNIPSKEIELIKNYRELLKTNSNQIQKRHALKEEFHYTLQRYKPALYDIIKGLIYDNLNQDDFPFFDCSDKGKLCDRIKCEKSKWKVNDNKLKWKSIIKRDKAGNQSGSSSRRIIIFVIGGLTLSELRECYELSNESVDVFVGSTHLITPEKFLDDIKKVKPAL